MTSLLTVVDFGHRRKLDSERKSSQVEDVRDLALRASIRRSPWTTLILRQQPSCVIHPYGKGGVRESPAKGELVNAAARPDDFKAGG